MQLAQPAGGNRRSSVDGARRILKAMDPARQEHPLTLEEYLALPDADERYELVAGFIVAEPRPLPRHGWVAVRIASLLERHVRAARLGAVSAESGFLLGRSPDTLRGPDVAFVSRERLAAYCASMRGYFPGPPDLAVEVLSPSDRWGELRGKVADYLAAGTRMVWVVDPERRQVTTYRALLAPRILREDDVLEGEAVVPGFSVAVAELFDFEV